MKKRCPDSKFIKPVYLDNAQFRYDGFSKKWNGAVANIIDKDGGRVWGGLFEVSEKDLDNLDHCEGYPNSYDRRIVQVVDVEGNTYKAWVYFRIGRKEGRPSEEYRHVVLEGVKDCNLPEGYIKNNIL